MAQHSSDLENWSEFAAITPGANQEASLSIALTKDWLRLAITLDGPDMLVNCWVVGDFFYRAAPGP